MTEALQDWVTSLPLAWALPLTFAAFAVLTVLIWRVPRAAVVADAPDGAFWRDLRLWATLLIAVQLGIYLLAR